MGFRLIRLELYRHPILGSISLDFCNDEISFLQNEIAQNEILRAGRHWRENGEKSAGYLKRTIESRAIKRSIESFIHPDTNEKCTSPLTFSVMETTLRSTSVNSYQTRITTFYNFYTSF